MLKHTEKVRQLPGFCKLTLMLPLLTVGKSLHSLLETASATINEPSPSSTNLLISTWLRDNLPEMIELEKMVYNCHL